MDPKTNLPAVEINDSAARTKLFFDTYGQEALEFNATEVDATINFSRDVVFPMTQPRQFHPPY
jgi:hypothetical protein